jgi:hypothetical protein
MSFALALHQDRPDAEHLFIHPADESVVELHELLTRHVGQHGSPFALIHQIPHRRYRGNTPALVGQLGIVGNEVKLPTPMTQTALLHFMAAHRRLAW